MHYVFHDSTKWSSTLNLHIEGKDYINLQQTSPIMLNVTMGQACKTPSQK
jgi:hypothetical protein